MYRDLFKRTVSNVARNTKYFDGKLKEKRFYVRHDFTKVSSGEGGGGGIRRAKLNSILVRSSNPNPTRVERAEEVGFEPTGRLRVRG